MNKFNGLISLGKRTECLSIVVITLMLLSSVPFAGMMVGADKTSNHDTDKDFKDGALGTMVEILGIGTDAVLTLKKTENWEPTTPKTNPGKGYNHALGYDTDSDLVILFGGVDSSFNYLNKTWIYNTTNGTWYDPHPSGTPPRRYGAAMAYDPDVKLMILYGGYSWGTSSCSGYCSDTWAYNSTNNTWFKLTPVGSPGPRFFEGLAHDAGSGRIVMFGGYNGAAMVNQVWLFDFTANTWTNPNPTNPPPARYGMGFVYNTINSTLLTFGGYTGSSYLDDTWQLNVQTNSWAQTNTVAKPPARYNFGMSWDERLQKVLVFGGYQSTLLYLNDSWTFDPTLNNWVQLHPVKDPGAGYGMRMVYAVKDKVDIFFGGYFPGPLYSDKTWMYGELFNSNGNFTSATIDSRPTGTTVNWVNISARATINEGEVTLQVSANDDNTSWYYVGPDGTILTRYTELDGEAIWNGHNGKRYLRYKLYLTAKNPLKSPSVDKVTVLFNRLPIAPVLNEPTHYGYVTTNRPVFNVSSKELDNKDNLRYTIELSTDNFNTIYKVYDQSVSLDGWSKTKYTSEEPALFTIPVGMELENGKTYQWRAKAFDGRDWSQYSVAWWFTVDMTVPEAPYSVSDGLGNDIDFTGDITSLSAHWDSAGDPESGIMAYWYCIGTTPGGSDVKPFTNNGIRTAVTASGLSLTAGTTYYFSVKAENGAGLFSSSVGSDGQIVDTSAPTTPVVKDQGEFTNMFDELYAEWFTTDKESGIIENRYAIGTESGATDIVNWTSIGGANAITHSDLNLTEGATYFFSVKSMNNVGDWSNVGSSDGITVDFTAPYDLSLSIVNAKGSTNKTTVNLWVGARDDVSGLSEIQVSNDGSLWSGWVPYAQTKDWALSSGDGPKTIYLQVRDKAGNIAGGASTSILLDTVKPTLPTLVINGGAQYTNTTFLTLGISAYDTTSGVTEMALSQDGISWSWDPYTTSMSYVLTGDDGTRQVYLKVRDAAGNEAGPVNGSIILDTRAPTDVTVVINDNVAITKDTQVWLKMTAQDATSGVSMMSMTEDGVTWTNWEPFASQKAWNLRAVVGVQTVRVRVTDKAGNIASPAADSIAYGQDTMTLTITRPAKNANVHGEVKVTGTAISDTPITSVQIRIDGGVWKDCQGGRDWSFSWPTEDYPDGVHVIEVRAQNTLGYSYSDPVEVKVKNQDQPAFSTMAEVGALILVIVAILVFALVIGFFLGRPKQPQMDDDLPPEEEPETDYPDERPAPVSKGPAKGPSKNKDDLSEEE